MIRYLSRYQTRKQQFYVRLMEGLSDALENGDSGQVEKLKRKFVNVMVGVGSEEDRGGKGLTKGAEEMRQNRVRVK